MATIGAEEAGAVRQRLEAELELGQEELGGGGAAGQHPEHLSHYRRAEHSQQSRNKAMRRIDHSLPAAGWWWLVGYQVQVVNKASNWQIVAHL